MIWLQSPPWGRWAAALLIAAGAIWIEFRPEPTTTHPFAVQDIAPGTIIDETNTETRPVPMGTFAPVELGLAALGPVLADEPVLASGLGQPSEVVPEGWWSLEMPLPRGARSGDAAQIVLLDNDQVASGIVVESAVDDPLGSGQGLVAVEPERAPDVARAAGEGRAVVMIAPP
ncbi:MAG: hypothetical protein ACRDX9_06195 [Acidimicrobiia bacterium]